ncbi:unnamed protein product [Meganyctiphanes norvegica]|uniref:NADH dehydrogenase subunit 6 n=1 Tax=Meganyctiphanes norvegica TaxID=48144 RepID=A0AAV2ST78_MEGNR
MALLLLSFPAWYPLAWTNLLCLATLLPSSVWRACLRLWMGYPELMHTVLSSSYNGLSLGLASVLFDPGPLVGLYPWMAVSTYAVFFVCFLLSIICSPVPVGSVVVMYRADRLVFGRYGVLLFFSDRA